MGDKIKWSFQSEHLVEALNVKAYGWSYELKMTPRLYATVIYQEVHRLTFKDYKIQVMNIVTA